MRGHERSRRFILVVAACGLALSGGVARAAIISTSPTSPPLDAPFVSADGVGCFPAAGVCVQPGSLTLTPWNQRCSIPPVRASSRTLLRGHPDDAVQHADWADHFERNRRATGSGSDVLDSNRHVEHGASRNVAHWSGAGQHADPCAREHPFNRHGLNEAIADGNLFRIDSFFDIFVQLSLDSVPPLTATRGPIHAELAPAGVPEPSVVTLLAAALLGLVGVRGRRRTH